MCGKLGLHIISSVKSNRLAWSKLLY